MEKQTPVVIFAGGVGSRLGEHTTTLPKPLVSVGGVPILYRIMDLYSAFGFNDFIILGGYLFDVLRSRLLLDSQGIGNVAIDFGSGKSKPIGDFGSRSWKIQLIDTGANSETGRRLALAKPYLEGVDSFFLTYGDGLSDVNFDTQLSHHLASKKSATVTAVRSPSKYGHLEISETGEVTEFVEKPADDGPWINGGFFVMDRAVFQYLDVAANKPLEQELLPHLAASGELNAFTHTGFWKCMDSPKDKAELDALANSSSLPGE